MEMIPEWLGVITPTGMLLLAVWLLFRGKMIPDKMHKHIVDALILRAETAELRADKAEAQRDKLISTNETFIQLLTSIRDAAEGKEP